MIPELTSLISSSRAAYDIAKGISALKSEVERNESISCPFGKLVQCKKTGKKLHPTDIFLKQSVQINESIALGGWFYLAEGTASL